MIIDVTCALIVDEKGLVLVAQRGPSMSLPFKWEFPGGKIESNETPESCLIREIEEELNINIQIIESLPYNVHNYPLITIKLIPFICRYVSGEIALKEHANFKWLHKAELLDLNWADADISIVNHYLNHTNATN